MREKKPLKREKPENTITKEKSKLQRPTREY